MKFSTHTAVLSALSLLSLASAATISCDADNHCPEDSPCCSQYGECGVGAYCLGGCDPRMSFNMTSCMPMPVCRSRTEQFTTLDTIISNTEYLGNASAHNWVSSGNILQNGDSVLLAMPKDSVGAVLSSTDYMWYGKVSATMKSSRDQGVVSSFILMSDVKDEIDYEFVGKDLETVQTNFYWQGALNWTNSQNISLSDTFDNYHVYEIDWSEDKITWSVDGQVGRTLLKADTYNATSGVYQFPQTPSRMQFSIWPGGDSSNAPGTIAWAGGELAWNGPDLSDPGYYYVTLSEVTVECYNPPNGTVTTGSNAYKFNNIDVLSSDVEITNDNTILGSFLADGGDPNFGAGESSASAAVPTGAGAGGDANRGESTTSTTSTTGSSQTATSGSPATTTTANKDTTTTATTNTAAKDTAANKATETTGNGGFVQNSNNSASSSSGASRTLISSFLVIAGIASAMVVFA